MGALADCSLVQTTSAAAAVHVHGGPEALRLCLPAGSGRTARYFFCQPAPTPPSPCARWGCGCSTRPTRWCKQYSRALCITTPCSAMRRGRQQRAGLLVAARAAISHSQGRHKFPFCVVLRRWRLHAIAVLVERMCTEMASYYMLTLSGLCPLSLLPVCRVHLRPSCYTPALTCQHTPCQSPFIESTQQASS